MEGEEMEGGLKEQELIRAVTVELAACFADGSEERPDNCCRFYPDPSRIITALRLLIDIMFPGRMGNDYSGCEPLTALLSRWLGHAWGVLCNEVEVAIPFRWRGQAARSEGKGEKVDAACETIRIMEAFYRRLPAVRSFLIEDVRAAYNGDPAALTYAEVQLAYPGLLAITSHRLAHELYVLNVPIVPRVMSEWTHTKTGVDIHPGARIGHGFFIDHGTGVVIGETAEIGNRVKLYQGVTLGAKSFPLDAEGRPIKHIKRHPTVEDDVVIYANTTVLGGDTVIGAGSTISGGVFLTESVPPKSFVGQRRPELSIKKDRNGR